MSCLCSHNIVFLKSENSLIIVTILPLLWFVAMARLPFQAGSDRKTQVMNFCVCLKSVHYVWVEHFTVHPDSVHIVLRLQLVVWCLGHHGEEL